MAVLGFFRRYPLISRVVVFVLLPIAVVVLWAWMRLHQALPEAGATRLTQGVSAPVELSRDAQGAVHIRASNDRDAYFAVGYAHAQDRLWQLEVQRRMARGELSEVFGKDSIDLDVWFRTLGLHASARSAWPALSDEAKASLTAYTAGINAAIAANPTPPIEFHLLRIRPQPWTEIDALAWIKVFALNLSGNYRREIDRALAYERLTPRQLAVFFPDGSRDTPTTLPTHLAPDTLAALAGAHDRFVERTQLAVPGSGSNAWAVAGRHTADGRALLANDPHLGLQIPSLWYAIDVKTPTLQVSGMSLIGLPLVIFGRNERIAWGGTNMMADVQDLFVERANAAGTHYARADEWLPFETREERIRVRADFPDALRRPYVPVRLTVRRTRHGPIVSDHFRIFDAPVALRWTALDPDDTTYEAFFRLNRARDWNQFRSALHLHVAPALNMLYADRDGRIGYLGAGRIPLRREGQGSAPVPGWDDRYAWVGEVPPSAWPQIHDPASGLLINANNRIVGSDYPYFISNDWASPARARRIEQLLRARIAAGGKLAISDMARIQSDTIDLEAKAMMRVLRDRLPQQGHAATAADLLRDWNGEMAGDSRAAAIFQVWMRHLREQVFADELRGVWNDPQGGRFLRGLASDVRLSQLAELLRDDPDRWCDRRDTREREDCAHALAVSLDKALEELHKLRGDWSMQDWRWDSVHRTRYRHMPMSSIKPFDRIFERRVQNGGSENSINVSASEFAYAEGYLQHFGPGFRQIMAMGTNGVEHLYMNSTGQSGNIMSPHYDDMVQPFQRMRYVRLDTTAPTSLESRP